jgi:outer membrane receptor protein involved in Fe transport
VFYTHESSNLPQYLFGEAPGTGMIAGELLDLSSPSTFAEYAAFGDLTFHFTERFDIQLGGRESHNRQTLKETFIGPYTQLLGVASPLIYPEVDSSENAFTYLATGRFKVTPDFMLYARLASGYRPGGPNINSATLGVPREYQHDTTENYEFGVKGNVFEHALTFDASLYYIDWRGLVVVVEGPNGSSYNANGSRAKSQGVELSVEARPFKGMTVSGWVAFNDAVLTDAFPSESQVIGVAGDRLPSSSRISANIAVDRDFRITGSVIGFLGGSASYVGPREGVFASIFGGSPFDRQNFPGYTQIDLRTGMRRDAWTVNLFATNVLNKRGVLSGGLGTTVPAAFDYIQPRTIGLSASRAF